MSTENHNKKLLDLKRWEFCSPCPATSAAGSCIASSQHHRQIQLFLVSATSAYMYFPYEDGWVQVPSPALTGTFGAGAAIVCSGWSTGSAVGVAYLTATGGTTTTLNTNQTIPRNLEGYSVLIMSGPNAGEVKTIRSNTYGANSILTFTAASGSSFTSANTYRLLTPTFYALSAGTMAAGCFRAYDYATNTWASCSITGLPATIATDSRLVSTTSIVANGEFLNFATGTATSGGAATLTVAGKTWAVNQWTNYQIRITSGTGAGQVATIASNTATTITVASSWAIQPDATSQYAISGNDDYIYYTGNASLLVYRYSISTNTWTTLTSRGITPGAGVGGSWISRCSYPEWNDESNMLNGRYIYSFRGGASASLERYDITTNTWATITYAPGVETFSTGAKYVTYRDYIYIHDLTGYWLRFCVPRNDMEGWSSMLYTQGTSIVGDTAFDAQYIDGATEIEFVYMLLNTSNILLRQMVI